MFCLEFDCIKYYRKSFDISICWYYKLLIKRYFELCVVIRFFLNYRCVVCDSIDYLVDDDIE